MSAKKELTNLSKEELSAEILILGEKPFRAKQLWQWIYYRGKVDFDEMTNLSLNLRQKLAENFTITRPKIITEQISQDKTLIFSKIVEWVMHKTQSNSLESCEAVVSFFVQNCEVFYEIPE